MTAFFLRRVLLALLCVILVSSSIAVAATSETYSQAESLVRKGQWDQGIGLLEQLLETEPENLKARNLLGIALTGKGDLVAANREFEHAARINPHFSPALKNLAINEFTQKDVKAAERHFSQALALAPNDPVIHAYLGHIAYSKNQYRQAAAHLEKAGNLMHDPAVATELAESSLEIGQRQRAFDLLNQLDRKSLSPRLQFSLGLALARHEFYDRAIPYFQTVNAGYPDSYDAAFNLAVCYVLTRQFPQAIAVLNGIANRGHKTAELDNLLAEALEGNQQVQEAIDTLRGATQLAPKDENNYVDLATLCTKYDAYDLGLQIIDVGLHYHPESDRLIFQRGVLEAMKDRFDLAENDFQLASRLAPDKNLTYVALGVTYMQTGHLPEAIRSLRQRIKEKPNDPILLYLLGDALIRSGANPGDSTFAEARAALEQSVKLNLQLAASQVDLAKLYLKENRLDEARDHLERAKAIDPKDKTAYSQLAVVYRRSGKPELASAMLNTLNQLNEEDRHEDHRQRLRIADSATETGQR
jgi:tetratricopeptide (TPR) repeat protein